MSRPKIYLAAVGFLALALFGFWYAYGFKVFFLAKPVISG